MNNVNNINKNSANKVVISENDTEIETMLAISDVNTLLPIADVDFTYKIIEPSNNEVIGSETFMFEEESEVTKADKIDYMIASAVGLLTGLLDIFWVGEFSLDRAHNWGQEKVEKLVIKAAKITGYKKDDLAGAINYLEKSFPSASDSVTSDFGGGLQHHLRDFSHHPTIIGLIFSVLSQFTGYAYGTNTAGEFIIVKIKHTSFRGTNISSKIYYGIINWIFHLISDMAGSSSNPGYGTGIPGPILSTLKEISTLPFVRELRLKYRGEDIELSKWISKLFNGDFFEENEGRLKNRRRVDLRFEIGIFKELSRQAVPIIINDALILSFYSIRRLFVEIEDKNIKSLDDIGRINPNCFLPKDNRILKRMRTISCSTFVLTNFVGAGIKVAIKGDHKKNTLLKSFLLEINVIGTGRFILACKADSKYLIDDIRELYSSYIEEYNKKIEEYELKKQSMQFFILNNMQTRILYSLRLQMLLYDIANEKNKKYKEIKKSWTNKWKKASLESLNKNQLEEDFFIVDEVKLYQMILDVVNENKNMHWLYLIVLELNQFKGYYKITDDDKSLKKLKFSNNYIYDKFCELQNFINKDEYKKVTKLYERFENQMTNKNIKKFVGASTTLIATAATGGFALTFAPQIAVLLVGGSFASLSGAALTSASLAMLGGGSLAIGGFGMAGGTAIIAGGGALFGTIGSTALNSFIMISSKDYVLQECCKILTYCKVISCSHPNVVKEVYSISEEKIKNIKYELVDLMESLKSSKEKNDKRLKNELTKSIKYLEKCNIILYDMINGK